MDVPERSEEPMTRRDASLKLWATIAAVIQEDRDLSDRGAAAVASKRLGKTVCSKTVGKVRENLAKCREAGNEFVFPAAQPHPTDAVLVVTGPAKQHPAKKRGKMKAAELSSVVELLTTLEAATAFVASVTPGMIPEDVSSWQFATSLEKAARSLMGAAARLRANPR